MAVTYRSFYPRRLVRRPISSPSTAIRTSSIVFGVYLFACVSLLGLLNFEQLSYVHTPIGNLNGDDLLLAVIVLGSVPAYLKWRTTHRSAAIHALEIGWLVYLAVLIISALSAPVASITDMMVHLRFVSRFGLFFPTVVILNTPERRRTFLWFSAAIAVVGTVFNVAQALKGGISLFDSSIYAVELRGTVGDIQRVYLQITSYIAYMFLLSICASIVFRRVIITAFSAFCAISFLIIFFRSLWIGLACGVVVIFAIYAARQSLRTRTIATYASIPIVLVLAGLALTTIGVNAFADVMTRISDGTYALTTNSGTWGTRTDMVAAMFESFNWNDWWLTGAGLFGTFWTDFGIIDVFLHLGAIGLLSITFLVAASLAVGISTISHGLKAGDPMMLIIGGACTAFTVTLVAYSIVTSNFLEPYTMTCFAIATALPASLLATAMPKRARRW